MIFRYNTKYCEMLFLAKVNLTYQNYLHLKASYKKYIVNYKK